MSAVVQTPSYLRRHAGAGHGGLVLPGRWLAAFWIMAAMLTTMTIARVAVDGREAMLAATLVFIGGGLPHGSYDIVLLRRVTSFGRWGLTLAVCGYIGVALAMALAWRIAPLPALIVFVATAAIHFGEDWEMLSDPLLRVAAGAAVIAAPTLGHPTEVTALFAAMGDGRAAVLAQVITAAAPVALLVTVVGIAMAWQSGNRGWASATAACFLLLLILPPVIGFALFFVFLHSPRHLSQIRMSLPDMTAARWFATGACLSVAAALGWWIVQALLGASPSTELTVSAFQLLASVALPHLLLSRWLAGRLNSSRSPGEIRD